MKKITALNCIHSENQYKYFGKFIANGGNKMYTDKTVSYGTDGYIQYVLDTYSQTLIRLCYTYVRNICDAEDITQDVLVSLLKRGKGFESAEHEKAWLLRTAINKSKNHLKSGWVKRTVPLNETDNPEIDDSMSEKNQVMEAVLSLPEKHRTVIHLFYYNGYSIKEISEIVGKKPATVGTLLARGRTLLKNMMIGGFDEDEQVN